MREFAKSAYNPTAIDVQAIPSLMSRFSGLKMYNEELLTVVLNGVLVKFIADTPDKHKTVLFNRRLHKGTAQ